MLSGLRAAQLHRAKMHAEGLKDEQGSATAMKTGLTHRIGKVQQNGQLQGLTTISLEEQKIFLSIERLNRQLLCEDFFKADCIGVKLINFFDLHVLTCTFDAE